MRFDGHPLTEEPMEDPYCALFADPGAAHPRDKQLAVGILGALRSDPESVTVLSGEPGWRLRCRVVSVDEDSVERADDVGTDTVLRVRWSNPITAASCRSACFRLAAESCALLEIPVYIAGKPYPRPDDDPVRFDARGFRGRLRRAPSGAKASRIDLYKNGVLAERATYRFDGEQIDAHINGDHFLLGASQSGVHRDGMLRASLRLLREQKRRLPPRRLASKVHVGAAAFGAGCLMMGLALVGGCAPLGGPVWAWTAAAAGLAAVGLGALWGAFVRCFWGMALVLCLALLLEAALLLLHLAYPAWIFVVPGMALAAVVPVMLAQALAAARAGSD